MSPSRKDWTDTEKWILEQAYSGQIADLNLKYKRLDPSDKDTWTEERKVSCRFIETVLLNNEYKSKLTRRGLRISGAWITEKIDLNNARFQTEWSLENCRVEGEVDLAFLQTSNAIAFGGSVFEQSLDLTYAEIGTVLDLNKAIFHSIIIVGAKIDGQLNMTGAKVKGVLNMYSISIGSSLFMSEGTEFHSITLHGASVTGTIELYDAKISDKLDMNQLFVSGSVYMKNSEFQEIEMTGTEIRGQLDLRGTKFKAKLNMNQLILGGSLFMNNDAEFQEVNLINAKVKGQIVITESKVKGNLHMNSLEVAGHLNMSLSEFKEINLRGAKINGQLIMNDIKEAGALNMDSMEVENHLLACRSEFNEIVIANTKISGQLELTRTKVKGKLNMNQLSLGSSLFMWEESEFQEIEFIGGKIGGQLVMTAIKVAGKLDMNQLIVGSSLFMNRSQFQEVVIRGSRITGQASISESNIEGDLHMDSLKVESHLTMSGSTFQSLNMQSTNIGGMTDMTQVKVKKKLEMSSISLGSHLLMSNSEFMHINLYGANVHGQLDLTNAVVNKDLNMESISIHQSILLYAQKLVDEVNLKAANIGGSVYLSLTEISIIDFSGANIRGELHIGTYGTKPKWTRNSILRLRNTQVGTIEDGGEDSWPQQLDLDGFNCSRLGGLFNHQNIGITKPITDRNSKWFIDWLAKEKDYSPQPYSQLASILLAMGHSEKANTVLHASKKRERKDAWNSGNWLKWFGFTLLNITIGHGYGARYFRSLIWVLAFTMIGAYVISTANLTTLTLPSVWDKIYFSLDRLLPIIELNEGYKIQGVTGWQIYYFYFHELMGFLLGSFVVAGLAGVTKK